jgi:Flp pilus assembly protein protease CpaA
MISLGYVGFGVGLLALIAASIFDIKTREVPDWLNYSLIAFVFGSSLILSIYQGYLHIFFEAVLGLAVGLGIGLLMFYTGQWGGGDSKLIIGLAGLIGFSFSELRNGIPLFFIFIINILLAGAVYGLGFSIVKAIINFKHFKEAAEKKLRSRGVLVIRVVLLVLAIGAFIFLLFTKSVESALIFGFALSLFLFFYLWAFVSVVEQVCMIRKIKLSQLTEGDWLVGDIVKNKKVILKPSKIGVTYKEIALLKKNRIREVTIKIGIPFVPSFLIAYIMTFALGNWLVLLI